MVKPLCLGIALASGAPNTGGIIAGVMGVIVVGALSASPLILSLPAAGLVIVCLQGIQHLGYQLMNIDACFYLTVPGLKRS